MHIPSNEIYLSKSFCVQKKIIMCLPTLKGGGAEKVFIQLANYFTGQNLKVKIIASYGNDYDHLIDPKVEVFKIRNTPYSSIRKLNGLIRLLNTYNEIKKVLKKEQCDYLMTSIHETNIAGYMAHKHSNGKARFILRLANIYKDQSLPFFLRSTLKKALDYAHCIIANSNDTATSFKLFLGRDIPINIIGNPAYNNKEDKETKLLSNVRPYLIAVGRLEPQKNYRFLIESFYEVCKTNEDLQLFILGKGSLESKIKELITTLNLEKRVILKGFVKNPSTYYANATAFVLSSDFEGFGNVIVEAMSYGLPVISTDCPGGPNFILNKPNLGEICEIGNPKSMAQKIIKVIEQPENYNKKEIIQRAKDFSIDKIGEEYLKVIREA